jgi:uncharacterized membrane protein
VKKFKNNFIRCIPASEPEDIIWSNLEVSKKEKKTAKIKSYAFTSLVLLIGFAFILGFSILSENYKGTNLGIIIQTITSFLIIIINQFLNLSQKFLTYNEYHISTTDYILSKTLKMGFS